MWYERTPGIASDVAVPDTSAKCSSSYPLLSDQESRAGTARVEPKSRWRRLEQSGEQTNRQRSIEQLTKPPWAQQHQTLPNKRWTWSHWHCPLAGGRMPGQPWHAAREPIRQHAMSAHHRRRPCRSGHATRGGSGCLPATMIFANTWHRNTPYVNAGKTADCGKY